MLAIAPQDASIRAGLFARLHGNHQVILFRLGTIGTSNTQKLMQAASLC